MASDGASASRSEPAIDGGAERRLTSDSVFVITGAAGSIVSAITADLAADGGTFHLLDLIAEPDPADPDLERVRRPTAMASSATSPSASQARGERATPALVERELAASSGPRRPPTPSTRSAAPAAPPTGTRSTSPTARRSTR